MIASIIFLAIVILVVGFKYPAKYNTYKHFQHNCKPGDSCIFYDDNNVHQGYIIERRHDVTRAFDTKERKEYTVFTLNTFPHHDDRK